MLLGYSILNCVSLHVRVLYCSPVVLLSQTFSLLIHDWNSFHSFKKSVWLHETNRYIVFCVLNCDNNCLKLKKLQVYLVVQGESIHAYVASLCSLCMDVLSIIAQHSYIVHVLFSQFH